MFSALRHHKQLPTQATPITSNSVAPSSSDGCNASQELRAPKAATAGGWESR